MSAKSGPWHDLYCTARWQKIRRYQLMIHPLCKFCLEQGGIPVPATVADHVVPHHGNRIKFFTGALQSLCEHCHNRTKKQIETLGYRKDIGLDGWPLDSRHPVYRRGQ